MLKRDVQKRDTYSDQRGTMEKIILIMPSCTDKVGSKRLKEAIEYVTESAFDKLSAVDNFELWADMEEVEKFIKKNHFKNKKIVFVIDLGISGVNLEYYRLLKIIRLNPDMFEGSIGGILIDGEGELFTKNIGRELAFSANLAGMTFPGKPLVEATRNLYNFNIQARNLGSSNATAYMESVKGLFRKLENFQFPTIAKKVLAIHSGHRGLSNSLDLWDMARSKIRGEVKEISLRNGEIFDCKGCAYEVCKNFGERETCYYGGVITKAAYPALMEADALVMICPNYNDAVTANLTAFINRLTALFITKDFSNKKIYGIVVSGYSGGDIVGGQIISAFNMNKAFVLPSRAIMAETANDPGSIKNRQGILMKAEAFGEKI